MSLALLYEDLFLALMEADPEQDAKLARKANALANKIVAYVAKLRPSRDIRDHKGRPIAYTSAYDVVDTRMGTSLLIDGKKIDKSLEDLRIFIAPGGRGGGSMHHWEREEGVLYTLSIHPFRFDDPLELLRMKKIDLKRYHSLLVHEFIHYLDFKRAETLRRTPGSSRYMKAGSYGRYYNDPKEFNAYYQQGANQVEAHARSTIARIRKRDPRVGSMVMEYGSHDNFLAFVERERFWNEDFLERMEEKFRRKFKTRLFRFWERLHKKVMGAYKEEFGKEFDPMLGYGSAKSRQAYRQNIVRREWPLPGSSRSGYTKLQAPDPRLFIPGKPAR